MMIQMESLDHPAVEIKLPLDRDQHLLKVPQDKTLFLWTTLAIGTPDRIPQIRSRHGSHLFRTGVEAQEQISWTISANGDTVPLLTDSHYREGQYKGLAWWIAINPMEFPVSISVKLETKGEQPSEFEEPIVLWTEKGEPIPWGTTRESVAQLHQSDSPPSEFQTRQENLWGRHTVYIPRDI